MLTDLLLTDEEIYKLNEADTEDRKRYFWEAGLLDTCKAACQAQLSKLASLTPEEVREQVIRLLDERASIFYKYADLQEQDIAKRIHKCNLKWVDQILSLVTPSIRKQVFEEIEKESYVEYHHPWGRDVYIDVRFIEEGKYQSIKRQALKDKK